MVVTPDGRYVAVSYRQEHVIRVNHIELDCTLTLLHTLGAASDAPKPKRLTFWYPAKMCLAPDGNLLVCEPSNNRIQELSGLGEAVSVHVRFITGITQAWSIAMHSDIIAVGTTSKSAPVVLLSYATGSIIRTFGTRDVGRGNIGAHTEGVCFTLDGRSLLVADNSNKHLSKFRMPDGVFEGLYCDDMIFSRSEDVLVAPSGKINIADTRAFGICMFSSDGRTMLRAWSCNSCPDEHASYPTALALADNKLFVPDRASSHVEVFE